MIALAARLARLTWLLELLAEGLEMETRRNEMFVVSDSYLDGLLAEDVPYFDLTTHLLGIGEQTGTVAFFTREDCVLCGTEEVARIFQKLGATPATSPTVTRPSGSVLAAGESFFEATGTTASLHAGWKVCLNIFDHCSALATKTSRMVRLAHEIAPELPILTTRKSMPGTKPLMTKAVVTGGAIPHRLGLSETVLIFANHTAFLGGFDGLLEQLERIGTRSCEKKVFVEANGEQALRLAALGGSKGGGVDGIQFDKLTPVELDELVPRLRALNPHLTLIAAGGINESNVQAYAATGVDGLATTSLFTAKPLDMSARIMPIESS
jgi:molybdenum transport protein